MLEMDSTVPVIFKRSKAKPAGRTRPASPEQTKEENDQDTPSTLATKLKNKVKKSRPKSKLSFGGEEEEEGDGEVFQVKKSSLSRKLALGKNAAAVPLNLDSTTVAQNRGPTYDEAYLKELKSSTPNLRPVVAPMENEMSIDINEATLQTLNIVTADEASIPSESSITVAKERRERLRKAKISRDDDYISLAVTQRGEDLDGPHPASRLVREDDELGEVEEEFAEFTSAQERIALGKKSRKLEATRRREEMRDLIDEAAEEDEETQEWEQEQLRRGGHRTPEPDKSAAIVKLTYKPAPIPAMIPIPSLGSAMGRLAQQLADLTTSHANHTTSLQALAKEREDVDDREKEMRVIVEKAEEKRAWFSDFRDWIEGVANFFDAKYPLLEKLEEEHASLSQERFNMIEQRRRADDEDDLSTFFGPLSDTSRPQIASRDTDDFTPQISKRERRVARIARRQSRQSRQQSRAEDQELEEGYSTDSSLSPPDAIAYDDALKDLASRKISVLNDVKVEEFRNPDKDRWNFWREKYTDSYVSAWGGLGVVSVWEFWVRLEIVGWDCIENSRSMDSFEWYKTIYEYSHPGSGAEERELGPEGDLVASMISSAVIPRLCKLIEGGALNVYSAKHIRRVIHLAEEIEASVEDGNGKLQMLLRTISARFESAIASTEASVSRYRSGSRGMPTFNPETITARQRFLARRVKLLKNLLWWRRHTGDRFGIASLPIKLVEGCVIDVAQNGWEAGGEEFARRIASMLPNELIPVRLKSQLAL